MTIRSTVVLFCLILGASAAQVAAQVRPAATPTPAATRPTATPTPAPARPSTAAADVPPSRIALIDTAAFVDEKRGIFRYIDAVKSISPAFTAQNQELQNLQTRITALAEEIRKMTPVTSANERQIQLKTEEGTRLRQDFNTKRQRLTEDFEKKYQEVTAPLSELIGKAMDQFARERGITMTLDLSKLLPAMLTALPAVDVTDAFIADFNRKNPRTGAPPR